MRVISKARLKAFGKRPATRIPRVRYGPGTRTSIIEMRRGSRGET